MSQMKSIRCLCSAVGGRALLQNHRTHVHIPLIGLHETVVNKKATVHCLTEPTTVQTILQEKGIRDNPKKDRSAWSRYQSRAGEPQVRCAVLCRQAIARRKRACLPCRACARLQEVPHWQAAEPMDEEYTATRNSLTAGRKAIVCRGYRSPT